MGTVSWPDWPICSDRGPARESPLDFGVTATHGVEMVSRKPLAPPPIEIKQFTLDEIERGIAKLQRRIAEVEAIDSRHAAEPSAPERNLDAMNPEARCRAVAHASRGANRETG